MAALYEVTYREGDDVRSDWFHAASARSMKRAALVAAYVNLRKRFLARMKRKGRKVKYLRARCIG